MQNTFANECLIDAIATATVLSSTISNAVFNATGARLRSTPYKLEKVNAALQSV